MALRNFFLLCTAIFLFSCAIQQKAENTAFPKWELPFKPVEVVQFLKGSFGGDRFVFQIALSMKAESLSMIGLDGLGRRAFSLSWNEYGVLSQKAVWMPDVIKAEHILRDVMLAYWPLDSIQLQDGKVRQVGKNRIFENNGKIIISVTKLDDLDRWNGMMVIENHIRKYRIEIQSKEIGDI